MRIVIDVNVWVSGLLWGGVPGKILELSYGQRITSFVSTELLLELQTTLEREKFSARLQLRTLTPASAVAIAQSISEEVSIDPLQIPELRDQADAKIAATAIAAEADCLVTGDQDLLVLHNLQEIAIVTPSQFLNKLTT